MVRPFVRSAEQKECRQKALFVLGRWTIIKDLLRNTRGLEKLAILGSPMIFLKLLTMVGTTGWGAKARTAIPHTS